MSEVTRRQAFGIAAAAAAVAISPSDAVAAEDRPGKLMEVMEGFRKTIPPAQGLNEQNGLSVEEVEPYLLSHLAGVAARLGVKARAECLILLTYIKDCDIKVRFIAQQAINGAVKAYPSGMSIGCLLDTESECHQKMVLRFVELIGKLPA